MPAELAGEKDGSFTNTHRLLQWHDKVVDGPGDVTAGEDNGTTEQQLKLAYGPDSARQFLPEGIDVSAVRFSPDRTARQSM